MGEPDPRDDLGFSISLPPMSLMIEDGNSPKTVRESILGSARPSLPR